MRPSWWRGCSPGPQPDDRAATGRSCVAPRHIHQAGHGVLRVWVKAARRLRPGLVLVSTTTIDATTGRCPSSLLHDRYPATITSDTTRRDVDSVGRPPAPGCIGGLPGWRPGIPLPAPRSGDAPDPAGPSVLANRPGAAPRPARQGPRLGMPLAVRRFGPDCHPDTEPGMQQRRSSRRRASHRPAGTKPAW
jgi:hypothetical protein